MKANRLALSILASLAATAAGAVEKPPARFSPAHPKNYTVRPGGRAIDLVVIHTIEGSAAGAESWFQSPPGPEGRGYFTNGLGERVLRGGSSAHYIVGFDGAVVQMVEDKDVAWHAGNWDYNTRSIGIEHAGHAALNEWTEAEVEASAQLTAWLCQTYGIPADRNHIIEHKEVPEQDHWDPGPHFDWDPYMERVQDLLGGGSRRSHPSRLPEESAGPVAGAPARAGTPATAPVVVERRTAEALGLSTATAGDADAQDRCQPAAAGWLWRLRRLLEDACRQGAAARRAPLASGLNRSRSGGPIPE